MSPEAAGLRERKKQRTRETIVRVAHELFAERGYDATTIADIAEAADIAPRTFFGYFPTKEDVVFHDFDEIVETFGTRLRDRGADQLLEARAVSVLVGGERRGGADELLSGAVGGVVEVDLLGVGGEPRAQRVERRLVVAAVAEDLGVPESSLRPHMVAAAATAALDTLGTYFDEREPPTPQGVEAIIDEALLFLRGGLEALRRHPPG